MDLHNRSDMHRLASTHMHRPITDITNCSIVSDFNIYAAQWQ